MRPIDADELLSLYEGEDENLKVSLRVVKQNIKDAPTINLEEKIESHRRIAYERGFNDGYAERVCEEEEAKE